MGITLSESNLLAVSMAREIASGLVVEGTCLKDLPIKKTEPKWRRHVYDKNEMHGKIVLQYPRWIVDVSMILLHEKSPAEEGLMLWKFDGASIKIVLEKTAEYEITLSGDYLSDPVYAECRRRGDYAYYSHYHPTHCPICGGSLQKYREMGRDGSFSETRPDLRLLKKYIQKQGGGITCSTWPLFSKDDMVDWQSPAKENGLIGRFGEGPFKVVETKTVPTYSLKSADFPQMIVISKNIGGYDMYFDATRHQWSLEAERQSEIRGCYFRRYNRCL